MRENKLQFQEEGESHRLDLKFLRNCFYLYKERMDRHHKDKDHNSLFKDPTFYAHIQFHKVINFASTLLILDLGKSFTLSIRTPHLAILNIESYYYC